MLVILGILGQVLVEEEREAIVSEEQPLQVALSMFLIIS
jgi:hypothetical protein